MVKVEQNPQLMQRQHQQLEEQQQHLEKQLKNQEERKVIITITQGLYIPLQFKIILFFQIYFQVEKSDK